MHEHSLIQSLLQKIHQLALQENKNPVSVSIQLGALAHISADHFREHFEREIMGTSLANTALQIEEIADIYHPQAQDIVLKSLEFEGDNDGKYRNGH